MVTKEKLEKALAVIREYEMQAEQRNQIIRDSVENDCPSQDYTPEEPDGDCDGDGHYLCRECIHWNKNTIYQ